MEPAATPVPLLAERSTGSAVRPERPQELRRRFAIETDAVRLARIHARTRGSNEPDAVRLARIHARTRFALMSWPGEQEDATSIVVELMRNVVDHVGTQYPAGEIVLDLVVTEGETLLISVTDPSPEFPDFLMAITAQKSTGLARVRELGGETTWSISEDGDRKTVRVRMQPTSP
ncbi:hypothetical protein OG762_07910 [Streptomyces sp. NBC_01136]|uniref:ATP-binding protein n=1 Tax=unclassified Streptomyces TaxID=2593676 RepID=UPI0032465688|nr:hypothetical protein OG762_07910 [Streptomyces sp. NBC_01136]